MTPLLIFSLTLFAAVLMSCLTARTVLSLSVLFIIVGYVLAQPVFGVQRWPPSRGEVDQLAAHALLAVLFADGMPIGVRGLREAWHLPGHSAAARPAAGCRTDADRPRVCIGIGGAGGRAPATATAAQR